MQAHITASKQLFLKNIETTFETTFLKQLFLKKVLTKSDFSVIIGSNLNITKKDCDEEGWK